MRSPHLAKSASSPFPRLGVLRAPIADLLEMLRCAIDALVFPWSCPLCNRESSRGPFCAGCRQALLVDAAKAAASACPRCAHPVGPFADLSGGCAGCRGKSQGFDAAFAFGPYDGAVKFLCLELKHEQNAWLAPWLSDLLVDARRDAVDQIPADAWMVPVPLHRWRQWQRGYNQAEALACGLARRLNLPVRKLLRRVAATRQLAGMGPTERREVMHGVFRVRPNARLNGRSIILVDDVLTTGATCSAAARALKQAGAARVIVVVIGRTARTTL
jgi:ComF family protein